MNKGNECLKTESGPYFVKHLNRLTPAETLVILNGDEANLSSLLKHTFLDLLMRQALVVRDVERQHTERDPVTVYKYVHTGPNFHVHQALPHEQVFLSPFEWNRSQGILFRNLVKISYEKARSTSRYFKLVTSAPNLAGATHSSFFQRLQGKFYLTTQGALMKAEIKAEMASVEKKIEENMQTDRDYAITLMKSIGGNLFLLRNLDPQIAREYEAELFEEMKKRGGTGDASGAFCGGCFGGYSDYSHSFDGPSSHGDGGSDGGSGCGGDGGSGCGGSACGGGGCGGGGD